MPAEIRKRLLLAGAYCVLLILIFYQTAWSMVYTWWRTDTYAHGFIVVPIVIWMILGKREQLARGSASTFYPASIFIALATFGWLLAHLVDVLIVQQFGLVFLMIGGCWLLLGTGLMRMLAFPFGYLLLAVPMGEFLLPPLMDFTAAFAVEAIRLSGVPVYREGMYLTLPTGHWSVVEACSGLRYLIASITLGALYAYLSYSSYRKRLAFILLSAIVPLAANGLRAYGIIMIGHLSNMEIATGTDHLLYGWVFFGIVMFILFSIGRLWHDDPADIDAHVVQSQSPANRSGGSVLPAVALAILIPLIGNLAVVMLDRQGSDSAGLTLEAPVGINGWSAVEADPGCWRPLVDSPHSELLQGYVRESERVCLHIAHYLNQAQGAEVVHGRNIFRGEHSEKRRVMTRASRKIDVAGRAFGVNEMTIRSTAGTRLLWYWYRIGHSVTANPMQAKLFEARQNLLGERTDAALVTLSIPVYDDTGHAAENLADFLADMEPRIYAEIDRAALNSVNVGGR